MGYSEYSHSGAGGCVGRAAARHAGGVASVHWRVRLDTADCDDCDGQWARWDGTGWDGIEWIIGFSTFCRRSVKRAVAALALMATDRNGVAGIRTFYRYYFNYA